MSGLERDPTQGKGWPSQVCGFGSGCWDEVRREQAAEAESREEKAQAPQSPGSPGFLRVFLRLHWAMP